jgi:hypothetical protein
MFPVSALLPPLPRIKIVDVGAMTLGDGAEPFILPTVPSPARGLVFPADNAVFCRPMIVRGGSLVRVGGGARIFLEGEAAGPQGPSALW